MIRSLAIAGMLLLSTSAHAVVGVPTPSRQPFDLVVKYHTGAAPLTAAAASQALGAQEMASAAAVDPGLHVLRFSDERSLASALARLRADPNVERIERATWDTAQIVPNDPLYPDQWDKPIMRSEEAWDSETGNPANVLIVISDGAYNCASNPDITNCRQDLSFDAIPTVQPENFHGFHVVGIAAAAFNNGIYFAGVAGTTQFAFARFLNTQGSGSSANALLTINHAVALQQADPSRRVVLNMSWGGEGFQQFNQDALNALHAAGGIAVAAAGNRTADSCGTQKHYPAAYENVISVASTDIDDGLSSFSNFGNCPKEQGGVLLAAPGGDPGVWSLTNAPEQVRTARGTSMAAPQVTGAIALALSQEPDLTAEDIIARLDANSVPLGLPVISGGRLDLPGMLEDPQPAVRLSVACPIPPEVNQGSAISCDVGIRGVAGFAGPVALTCGGVPASTCAVTPATVNAGGSAVLTLTTSLTTPVGNHTVTVTGTSSVDPATVSTGVLVDPFGTERNQYISTEVDSFGKTCVRFACTTFSAETSINVPDDLTLLDLTGKVHITHQGFTRYIKVTLISPEGTVFIVPIPPLSPLTNLAINTDVFDGQDISGVWTVRVDVTLNTFLAPSGQLTGWELNLKAFPASS